MENCYVSTLYILCCYFFTSDGFLNIEELQEMRYALDILHTPINYAEVDVAEGLQLASKHGQKYFCKMPSKAIEMEQKSTNEQKIAADFPVVDLLEPLKAKPCLEIVKGWWTYEFCYMKSFRQYHVEDGEPSGEIISLGDHESDFDWSDEQKIRAKMFKKKRIQKYHSQYYVNGTECSVIKHKRDSEVRFYCDESATVPYIERVDEPSTCSYIVTIKTNLLCGHPNTRITYKSKPVEVLCQPLLSAESYQIFIDQQEKAELAAYEKANLLLRQKRDRLRSILLSLKEDAQSAPTDEISEVTVSSVIPSHDTESEILVNEQKAAVPQLDLKNLAIDFIQQFVPEEKFNNLGSDGQTKLLKFVVDLLHRFKTLPSADLARFIRFEILSYIERSDAFSSDFFSSLLRGITPATDSVDKVKQTSHGTVQIKVRTLRDYDEDIQTQDPEIEQLEKEIENELAEAGVISKRDIKVHFIASSNSEDKLSEIDARQFKDALIEIMGGTTMEEREKERFNRLIDNYNIRYKDAGTQFILKNNEKDEENTSNT